MEVNNQKGPIISPIVDLRSKQKRNGDVQKSNGEASGEVTGAKALLASLENGKHQDEASHAKEKRPTPRNTCDLQLLGMLQQSSWLGLGINTCSFSLSLH